MMTNIEKDKATLDFVDLMNLARIANMCRAYQLDVAEEEVRDRMESIVQRGNEEWQDYWDTLLGHELTKRTDAALYLSSMLNLIRSRGS